MQLIIEEEEIQTQTVSRYVAEKNDRHESGKPSTGQVAVNPSPIPPKTVKIPEVASTFASWHVICGVFLVSAQILYSALLTKHERRR